jgi:hypothetical protein
MTTEMPPIGGPQGNGPVPETGATEAPPPPETSQAGDAPTPDATAVTEMTPPAADPAPDRTAVEPPPGPTRRRRDRVLGTVGQVLGVVGLVVCLVLAVGVVAGHEWSSSTVDDVAAAVDAQIAKADPLLTQASARVGEISGRVSTVGDIAAGVAADPSPGGAVADSLRAVLATVSDRYQTLRASYVDVRGSVQSVIDRLQTLARIIPGFSIPQGPVDALGGLDARLQAFDAKVTGLITIDPGQGPVNKAAAAIAQAAGDVNTKLADLQGGIGDVQQRITDLRTKISDAAGSVKMGITLGSTGSIVLLLYLALLNWVLFRHSGEIRRKTAAG